MSIPGSSFFPRGIECPSLILTLTESLSGSGVGAGHSTSTENVPNFTRYFYRSKPLKHTNQKHSIVTTSVLKRACQHPNTNPMPNPMPNQIPNANPNAKTNLNTKPNTNTNTNTKPNTNTNPNTNTRPSLPSPKLRKGATTPR